MKTILTYLSVLVVAGAGLGCAGLADDVCDARCSCEGCSDRQYDDCVIRTDAQLDVYDTYGCDIEADELYRCSIDFGTCRDGDWRYSDPCDREREELEFCVGTASLLRGQPVPGPN